MSSLTAMTILPHWIARVAAHAARARLRLRGGCVRELHEDHRTQIGQPFVHHHPPHALDPEPVGRWLRTAARRRLS